MIYTLFFLLLTFYILTHSDVSLYYAFHGFTLWYSKMVPSLLPFMILSGTMVRMHLTERFVILVHPVLKRIFRCSPNVSYGILIGFLCGFPMGAKVATDLLREGKITDTEAKFLLAFCNNIGPVYFCSFVVPMLHITNVPLSLFGMYGIPLIYGVILRYTAFRRELNRTYKDNPYEKPVKKTGPDLLTALDESIKSGIGSISMLCGYMIIFNLLNIIPHHLFPQAGKFIAPILEITGGIGLNEYTSPYFILILLPFGGLSCIAQTNSLIKDTSLSIRNYTIHKCVTMLLTIIFYAVYLLLFVKL